MYGQKGTFLAADRQIDPKTGTIRLSATFPNPDHQLRPGQYGRVSAETKSEREAIVVPQILLPYISRAHAGRSRKW